MITEKELKKYENFLRKNHLNIYYLTEKSYQLFKENLNNMFETKRKNIPVIVVNKKDNYYAIPILFKNKTQDTDKKTQNEYIEIDAAINEQSSNSANDKNKLFSKSKFTINIGDDENNKIGTIRIDKMLPVFKHSMFLNEISINDNNADLFLQYRSFINQLVIFNTISKRVDELINNPNLNLKYGIDLQEASRVLDLANNKLNAEIENEIDKFNKIQNPELELEKEPERER